MNSNDDDGQLEFLRMLLSGKVLNDEQKKSLDEFVYAAKCIHGITFLQKIFPTVGDALSFLSANTAKLCFAYYENKTENVQDAKNLYDKLCNKSWEAVMYDIMNSDSDKSSDGVVRSSPLTLVGLNAREQAMVKRGEPVAAMVKVCERLGCELEAARMMVNEWCRENNLPEFNE